MLIYKNGVKNGVSTLLLFDKNGVPQHSLFDVKSENGVKNGVHTLFYMIAEKSNILILQLIDFGAVHMIFCSVVKYIYQEPIQIRPLRT